MRVALNMLFVSTGLAGGRVYSEGLLRGLAKLDSDDEFTVFVRRDTPLPELPADRFCIERAPISGGSVLWRTFWEYNILPRRVRRARFDVLHGLGSLSPHAKSCPLVATVHDLIYHHFPQSLPTGPRLFMKWMLPRVVRRADRIIVPSRFTGDDLVRHLGAKEDKIRVIVEGPGNSLRAIDDPGVVAPVLARFGIRRPYVLSVSRAYVHKNVAGLLRAFAKVRQQCDVQLVLVGERLAGGSQIDGLVKELGLDASTVFTGYVNETDLNALYAGADVFAFPSLIEGFGLPVLEAMSCGTPVVSSHATALPEVVGDAGLLADATDPEAFAAAIVRVLREGGLADDLRRRGRERLLLFTWEQAARETLEVYREVGRGS